MCGKVVKGLNKFGSGGGTPNPHPTKNGNGNHKGMCEPESVDGELDYTLYPKTGGGVFVVKARKKKQTTSISHHTKQLNKDVPQI